MFNRKLVLEDGHEFLGYGFGSGYEAISEVIFNTSVVGYQEILSDPANYNKIICMTYPVIGSYGLNDEDYESKTITVAGLIVREYNDLPSNFRYTHKLDEVMEEASVPGIAGVDTREIARLIRDKGTMKGIICDVRTPLSECLDLIRGHVEEDELSLISTKKVWYSRTTNPLYTVVALDLGIRKSVVKMLNEVGFNVIVVPYDTNIQGIMKFKPNAVLISDGPSNPNEAKEVIDLVNELKGKLPILGIGNGQNIIALSYNCEVVKEKVGHNGCNIPVKNLQSGKIEITSQNTKYVIDDSKINNLQITHRNVIDNVISGIENEKDYVIAVSYNPTLSDREDNVYLRLIQSIKNSRGEGNAKKNRR